MGDGLSTGPMVTWMENTETAAVVLVGSFIYKRIYQGTPDKDCKKGKDKVEDSTIN